MLSRLYSGATFGLETLIVEVEVDVASRGLPSITIVGLASKAVDESKQRVRSALKNSNAEFPSRRITINLAPADLPKEGSIYDMPIAVGLLIASEQLLVDVEQSFFFGEVSLNGTIRHAKGALPMTLLAKEKGFNKVFLPESNAAEARIVDGVSIFPVSSIKDLISHLSGISPIEPSPIIPFTTLTHSYAAEFDFEDIKGQEQAKRALEIAAAGGHNTFLYGPPGGGKTMMARAFGGILPSLQETEAIEVTKIYSVTGNIPADQTIITSRPFRSPHHTTSRIGLIGGGSKPMPGEISLAHRGVLFLDEFPEFTRSVLESLRQPMEDGVVTISRAAGTVKYPARFTLIAAANPCPCGNFGSLKRKCVCLPGHIQRYQKKISGPILDRIDLHLEIPEVDLKKLTQIKKGETSEIIRERVNKARKIQTKRYSSNKITCNTELGTKQLRLYCQLETQAEEMLLKAATRMNVSARSYNKIVKVSRTIADLDNSVTIKTLHVAEALQYRPTQP